MLGVIPLKFAFLPLVCVVYKTGLQALWGADDAFCGTASMMQLLVLISLFVPFGHLWQSIIGITSNWNIPCNFPFNKTVIGYCQSVL